MGGSYRVASVALVILLLMAAPLRAWEQAAGVRPNVLFIAVDDLRPSLGCYGDPHAKTPNIDQLADRGVRFERAYCQVAVCNPSRASMMTGLRPDRLGIWTLPIHFRESVPDAITIPQWFRKFGYTAVSHGKIFHNPTPDPQSWSEPRRALPPLKAAYPVGTPQLIQEAQSKLPEGDWRKRNLRGPSTSAPEVEDHELLDGARTQMAIDDLRRLSQQEQPFFLAMGYIRPHLPWIAPKKYWDLHDPNQLPVLENQQVTPDTPPYALSNNYELTHYVDLIDFPKPWDIKRVPISQARHLMHGYYASVSYIDSQIGLMLDELEQLDLSRNTIVVLWSDHGWKLGEFNGWGKMTNYEIDTRVPLIISSPHLPKRGTVSNDLAELLDVFPTLCDLAKIDTPDFLDGTSLLPNLQEASVRSQDAAYSQYYRKHNEREYMGYAVRTDTHRFVEWRDFATGAVTALELYDHRKDSSETQNLASSADRQLLDSFSDKLLESHPRKPLSLLPSVHSDPSPNRWRVALSFENLKSSDVKIYPITPQGRRGRLITLRPGETITIQARIGGVFVAESVDGRIHQIHSPSFPPRKIQFDDS